MKTSHIMILVWMLSVSTNSLADTFLSLSPYAAVSYDIGGSSDSFVDDETRETHYAFAGEGIAIKAGLELELDDIFLVRGVAGYKTNIIDVDLFEGYSHIPVEASAHILIKHIGLGAGITRHYDPYFRCWEESCIKRGFDDADGQFFELSLRFKEEDKTINLSLRYTDINYTPADNGLAINGANIGVHLGASF